MLAVIGASHHEIDLADLERLSAASGLSASLGDLAGEPGSPVAGAVLLSTCNRVEIYLDLQRFHDGIDAVVRAVAAACGWTPEEVSDRLAVRVGSQVPAHLFRVAAGLESMVVGEMQVSGQVAEALRAAQRDGVASTALLRLFQAAARTAKQVATRTDLHSAGRSLATVALDAAERRVGPLAAAEILLIGTGAYARVVAAELRRRGCTRVGVFSASGRQQGFAAKRALHAVPRERLAETLARCAVVVSCSGTRRPVLDAMLVGPALAGREDPLCLVDLALQPDVPPEVRGMPGVTVIDLTDAAGAGQGVPESAVLAAEQLVMAAAEEFDRDLASRRLDPAVVALREHVATTVQRELERVLPRVSPEAAAEVTRAAHRLTRSLLHTPTIRARMLARSGDERDYLRALHTLFGIDVASMAAGPGPVTDAPDSSDAGEPSEVGEASDETGVVEVNGHAGVSGLPGVSSVAGMSGPSGVPGAKRG